MFMNCKVPSLFCDNYNHLIFVLSINNICCQHPTNPFLVYPLIMMLSLTHTYTVAKIIKNERFGEESKKTGSIVMIAMSYWFYCRSICVVDSVQKYVERCVE